MFFRGKRKPKNEDICRFFRAIRRYRNGGIAILQAMEYYKADCENVVFQEMLAVMIKDMQNGLSFSAVLKKQSAFPPFVSQLVKVGEDTGELSKILEEIVFFLEQEIEMKKNISSDLFTVKIFVVGAILALLVAVFVVIPMMHEILEDLSADLPAISKLFINFGLFLRDGWPLFILLAIAGIILYLQTPKEKKDRLKLKIPFYSNVYYCELQYRLTKILSLITYSNIPITTSLRLLANSIDHIPLQNVLAKSAMDIQNSGMSSVDALTKNDKVEQLIAKDILIVLRAAERTNSIASVMQELADDFRKDLYRVSKKLPTQISMAVIIPTLFGLLLLMVSIYMPIMSLMNAATSLQ